MKHKASLLLMEQLIMILVFTLAAVLCLRVFLGADQISRETARQDRAVILAQNGAEAVKATGGDLEQAAILLGGSSSTAEILLSEGELQMRIRLLPSRISGLGQAEIAVTAAGETLISLTAAWQEVAQ